MLRPKFDGNECMRLVEIVVPFVDVALIGRNVDGEKSVYLPTKYREFDFYQIDDNYGNSRYVSANRF